MRHPQHLAAELAAHLSPETRTMLIDVLHAVCMAAETEGAGAGIWYIYRAITEEINRTPPTCADDPSRSSDR